MERLPLTTRQKEILEYLELHTHDYGYPPTVREICRATGLKSPRSVSQHLQALERKSYIHRERDKSRAIRFLHRTESSSSSGSAVSLPLRGCVAAGPAANAAGIADASYVVDRALFAGDGNFLMKVEGACMVDAHILEGDLIVVSPGRAAASGASWWHESAPKSQSSATRRAAGESTWCRKWVRSGSTRKDSRCRFSEAWSA